MHGFEADTRPLRTADGWVLGGRYRVLERVGSGGMAEVFRARDQLLDRDVAVKVFRTLLDDPDASTNAATRRELELQAMARLNHPNLVTLYDGSVAGDGPAYLVLEFVDGSDLATRLRSGPLPEPQARELGTQLADALGYVHAHGLVHRDVKPANILLGDDRARLSDFGVVRMVGQPQLTSAELTIGTAFYLAPEQARGSAVGPEADVYALGLVLLEALTGRRAFDGPMHEALAARLAVDPEIPADLPAPWPALLAAMTARDPAARPDAVTVAQQLRAGLPTVLPAAVPAGAALAADAPTTATPAAAAASAEADSGAAPDLHSGRRHPLRLAALAAAAVLAAAVGVGAYLLQARPAGTPPAPAPSLGPVAAQSSSAAHHPQPAAPVADLGTAPGAQVTHARKPKATRSPSRSASSTPSPSTTPTKAPTSPSSTAPTSGSGTPTGSATPSATSAAPTSSASTIAGGAPGAVAAPAAGPGKGGPPKKG